MLTITISQTCNIYMYIMNFLQISLSKDKLLEMDLLYRNYDYLSTSSTPTTQAKASRTFVENCTMEENYAFNNVHHIYDQVLLFFKLVLFF